MDRMILIDGVIITPLNIIPHEKGDIFHAMRVDSPGYVGFGEAYFSTIKFGEIKAWKKHFKMTLNLIVPIGEVKFVLYDDRENSKTNKIFNEIILSKENYNRLTIPHEIWMGFKGLAKSDNIILNIANYVHDPEEQVNKGIHEIGIHIDW